MKKIVLFLFLLSFIFGCGEDKGRLRVWLIDAPPPRDVEKIGLRIIAVGIRNAEGKTETIANYYDTVDIVKLNRGAAASLTHSWGQGNFVEVEPGDYKSVLLWLTRRNFVIRNGTEDTLLIPDSIPNVYELEQNFSVLRDQGITIVIDFDASKSINWESQPYELDPLFRIYKASIAGFVKGTVKDTSGAFLKRAEIQAVSSTDTFTTLSTDLIIDTTDVTNSELVVDTHSYAFMLPEGTYDINAFSVDSVGNILTGTTYENVTVIRDSLLKNYNFVLE